MVQSITSAGANGISIPDNAAKNWNSTALTAFNAIVDALDRIDPEIASQTIDQDAAHTFNIGGLMAVVSGGTLSSASGSTVTIGASTTLQINSAITSASATDVVITPYSGRNLVVNGLSYPNADGTANYYLQTDGAGTLSFANPIGSFTISGTSIASAGNTTIKLGDNAGVNSVLFTDSDDATVASIDSNGALLAATLDLGNSGAVIVDIKDEDDMASNSAVSLSTQQAIKAYVDAQIATVSPEGAYKFLSKTSASASSNVDIALTSGYQEYLIIGPAITISADNKDMWFRARTESGSVREGASDYEWGIHGPFNTEWKNDFDNSDSKVGLNDTTESGWSSVSGRSVRLELKVTGARSASLATQVNINMSGINSDGNMMNFTGSGFVTTSEDNDLIRITMEDSTTITGDFIIYGLKEE